MAEAGPREKRLIAATLALGVVLTVLCGFGGVVAALSALLAQPLLALGLAWRSGVRAVPRRNDAATWLVEVTPLLLVWGVGSIASALLLAWPLTALLRGGGLGAALAVSAVIGGVLLALWRSMPLWRSVECESAPWPTHLRTLSAPAALEWHGLAVAAPVALAIAGGLLLAWPGLLSAGARWSVAVIYALLLPGVHGLLQGRGLARARTADALPVVEMKRKPAPVADGTEETAAAASPRIDGDLDAQLYEAARSGRVERALELLDAGADPHAVPAADGRDQRGLAALAAVLPDLRLLRALIARGIDLNAARAGVTPLLAATRDSWHGRPDAVTTLLANGADPRAQDNEGNTPLHHAARSSDPGVAALLRDAAAEIDASNHEGQTPLGVACMAGNWRLAKFLLERGAKPEPDGGQPALLAAAATEEDDPAGVQLLLKHKARATTRDARDRSALHEAALAGHAGIVEVLLDAGAEVNAADIDGCTPWLDAARGGSLDVLKRLTVAGAYANATDILGRNALMQACAAEALSPALVRRLLEAGVDPDHADNTGKRAIDLAAEAGRWAVVAALDPTYALPVAVAGNDESDPDRHESLPDRPPLELLRDALREGRLDGHDALLKLCTAQELGRLLHDPQLRLAPSVLDWLLQHGADPDTPDAEGRLPLPALLGEGARAVPSIEVLLRHGLPDPGTGGLARFLAAVVQEEGMQEEGVFTPEVQACALQLLEHGADTSAPPQDDPPLALAVRLDALPLLDRLLDAGADREARDRHGMTALHLAAALGRDEAVKRLVAQGASPTTRAADGQTPLGVALSSGRRDLADWLEWRGWPLPGRALAATDLPAAAMAGDTDALRKLLELGFEVDATDAQGCTALLRAAGGGHRAVVDLLLARGADPQHAAGTGATPLSAAVSMRQADIVGTLLQAGAHIEQRLPGGVTVLMLAAALGLPDIAARLLTAGADVHASDAQGLTPLHCAGLFGFIARDRPRLVALLDILLLAGAEPEVAAAGLVTPLLLLLGARAEPGTACDEDVVLAGLERSLEEEVSLEVQDPRGFGPLHLAALHGLPRVVQRLLRAGADPTLRDSLNRSPREIAVMRGFIDIAAQFDPATGTLGNPPTMARFLREPRA
ncbi:MAG: ankyrin repeat domain-containing protein [Pseudoxanthomonas sp.]